MVLLFDPFLNVLYSFWEGNMNRSKASYLSRLDKDITTLSREHGHRVRWSYIQGIRGEASLPKSVNDGLMSKEVDTMDDSPCTTRAMSNSRFMFTFKSDSYPS
uniref:Uncharacterized protein n=1 Tax=Heterorhabditis bacteriophora TaxID=37862 RepID=A0A1I7XJE1_HETBA